MREYRALLTGDMPMLMHRDDVEAADALLAWRLDEANVGKSKAGDDRSPGFTWLSYLYHDGNVVVVPAENIMRALADGGAMLPTGKGKATFKRQSQSGIIPRSIGWPLLLNGKTVPVAPLLELAAEVDFGPHADAARRLGFSLLVKRAKIGQTKHIRVRPKFDHWSCEIRLSVRDDAITKNVLSSILSLAGQHRGLGDWRPGAPTSPGPYGTFTASVSDK